MDLKKLIFEDLRCEINQVKGNFCEKMGHNEYISPKKIISSKKKHLKHSAM